MPKHWIESEDKILKEHYELGKSWFEISLLLPRRNAKAVQRRWYYINFLRKSLIKNTNKK